MGLLPLRTQTNGPAPLTKDRDIIDEALEFFRVNVLFKSFDIKGPADVVLVYLLVCIGQCFKITENEYILINTQETIAWRKEKAHLARCREDPQTKGAGIFHEFDIGE